MRNIDSDKNKFVADSYYRCTGYFLNNYAIYFMDVDWFFFRDGHGIPFEYVISELILLILMLSCHSRG